MTDHLTRVADAVRAACFEACNENGGDMGAICTVDLSAVIASVPRPEPVAWQPGIRPPSVFKTSDAGRQFVADYFASGLRRHDFSSYIKSRLAADFACALADGLHAMLAASEPVAAQPAVPRPEPVATMVPAGAKVWFSYDGDSGFDVHNTAEEARQTAQQAIDEYRDDADPDDGWPEQVENVCWGVVLDKTREVEIHDGYDGSAGLAGCGRPVDYVLASEPVAAQPAVPDGWKMVPVEPTPGMLMAAGAAVHAATYWHRAYCAMLAAAPEAPQDSVPDRRVSACLTAMDHISTETLESFNRVGIKFDATRGYAEELEAEIATLRSAIRAMASMLQAREWAEHVSTDPDVTDLEVQVTELVGTATTLREQNAALVAALEGYMGAVLLMNESMESGINVQGAIAGLIGYEDMARAALASVKGDK